MAEGPGGPQGSVHVVQLKRNDTGQTWGMRLRGGTDTDLPLHVEGLARNGRAHHAGLRPFDVVVAICGSPVTHLTHDQVKGDILRAGNDLDMTVHRGVLDPKKVKPAAKEAKQPRAQITEEHVQRLGGPTFKPVKPKTYQILEDQLPQSEGGDANYGAMPSAVPVMPMPSDAKPASIFDRKRDDRSDYLVASETTIQKAYGQSQ